MKIKELYIRQFGKLKDYKLALSDGMNVLYGNNEAGKTTVFNFILAMLYGFSNTRGKSIGDSARKKYMTWGENKIGGTLTVEQNGVTYVIDRVFGKTKAGDSRDFKNLTLGESVSLPNDKEVGEYLFDLDEKSFKGTCFIGQLSKDDVCDNDNVITKLSNLSNVGDAEYSFDDVFNRLKNASLEIARKTTTGKVYPLELRKNELESRNRAVENELSQISSIDAENKALESRAVTLSTELSKTEDLINKSASQKKALEYKNALENNNKIEAAYLEYKHYVGAVTRKGFTADRGYIDELNLLIKKRDDTRLKYEYEEKTLENEKKTLEILASSNPKNKKTAIIPIVCMVVLAALLIGAVLMGFVIPAVIFGLGILTVCVLLIGLVKKTQLQSDGSELESQRDKVNSLTERVEYLKSECAQCDGEFSSKFLLFFESEKLGNPRGNINDLSSIVDRCFESKIRYDAIKDSAVSEETLAQMRVGIDESDLDAELKNVDVSELESTKTLIRDEIFKIEKTLLVNKERVKNKGALEAELESNLSVIAEIDEKIKSYRYSCECLELAKQGLENAQKEMQKQFAPDVNRLVSEILGEITCGKYDKMTLNTSLQTMIIDNESGVAIEDGYMSAGTLDQVYLALRFAMIKLIFADKEYPIICMDDALLNFDLNRMKKATEYIKNVLSKDAQVLFFTCRDTEKSCFDGAELINV